MNTTAIKPSQASRQDLGADAIVEIEYSVEVILRLIDTQSLSVELTPVRGLALRIRQLAGVALGAIDHETQSIATMRKALGGQIGLAFDAPRAPGEPRCNCTTHDAPPVESLADSLPASERPELAAETDQPVQASAQGPQFADIAHLVAPGRVPTVDGCVLALHDARAVMDACQARAKHLLQAIEALLPCSSGPEGTHHAAKLSVSRADISAVHELLEITEEAFDTAAGELEAVCSEVGLVAKKGGAA